MHEVNILDQLLPEAGAFYVMDRGYLDFERLYRFHEAGSFFVTRGKIESQGSNAATRIRSIAATGLICDQTVVLTGFYSHTGLPGAAASHSLQRSRDRQDADLPDQQLHLAGTHDHRALPLPLAGRTVLQMDQAASADQGVLRHLRERGQVANLDRGLGLRPGRHRQKAAPTPCQPLRNPTDLEPDHVRTNAVKSTTCASP